MGCLIGCVAAVATWFATVLIAAGVMTALGLHPDKYGVAPLAVIIIGPGLGILAWIYTSAYFAHWEEEQKRAEVRAAAEEEARKQAVKARKQAEERRHSEQRALANTLSNSLADCAKTVAILPSWVQSAEKSLDHAEEEFADGAFAPFWDAVEEAANTLARFNNTIELLVDRAKRYKAEAPKLDIPLPPFQLGVHTLPDATHTANRMRGVVRRAQKDFHFATIYEQRKTNQLLVGGFTSLAQAINQLGDRIQLSLENLATSISISVSELISAQEAATSELASELQLSREQALEDSQARREHERQERDMLDNIQRRRRPLPPGLRDGQY
jgi:hypothetical protein